MPEHRDHPWRDQFDLSPKVRDNDAIGGSGQDRTVFHLTVTQRFLCPVAANKLLHLVMQQTELGYDIHALLEVCVGSVVQSLNDNFFPAATGEKNEGRPVSAPP